MNDDTRYDTRQRMPPRRIVYPVAIAHWIDGTLQDLEDQVTSLYGSPAFFYHMTYHVTKVTIQRKTEGSQSFRCVTITANHLTDEQRVAISELVPLYHFLSVEAERDEEQEKGEGEDTGYAAV